MTQLEVGKLSKVCGDFRGVNGRLRVNSERSEEELDSLE